MDDKLNEEIVKVYKALGEPTRLKIVQLLKNRELSCMEVEENLKASSLSHHMKQLHDAGVLQLRKEGTYRYYTVDRDVLKKYMPLDSE